MKFRRNSTSLKGASITASTVTATTAIATHTETENTTDNVTMFQAFEWHVPSDYKHYIRLRQHIPQLKSIGVDNLWLPPGCKAGSINSNGYDIYDLFDIGEFEQKGARSTKWGSKEELLELVRMVEANGMGVYWDAVLNHRAGADGCEEAEAVRVDPKDRNHVLSDPHPVSVWTKFNFPGRGITHSSFEYNARHFSGIDYDAKSNSHGIFRLTGPNKPGWAEDVDPENGNYDYLMLADVDYGQEDVREEVKRWGEWLGGQLGRGLKGVRFDAIKHYSESFLKELITHLDATIGKHWFFVGEYWNGDARILGPLIKRFNGRMSLFDVQLVYNLSAASKDRGEGVDFRTIFTGTLSKLYPRNAVTFVANHDTQAGQALEAVVEPWFTPLAYALILLREGSGYPCVFYGDLYGIQPGDEEVGREAACGGKGRLARMILVRKMYAYGSQREYVGKEGEWMGWTREGVGRLKGEKGSGVAVLLNSGWECRTEKMGVGICHAGERWTDVMGWAWGEVLIDQNGEGMFPVGHRGMSIWVNKEARGRKKLNELVFDDDIYGAKKSRFDAFLKMLDNGPGMFEKLNGIV